MSVSLLNNNYIICNAKVVNEGCVSQCHVYVHNGMIEGIYAASESLDSLPILSQVPVIDAHGQYLMPGMIDAHVHFRQPGATHKADMYSESRAALAGGVTSVMDMPNVNPPTVTNALLEERFEMGHRNMQCNYSFYLAATDGNISEIQKIDKSRVCGVKLFIGSSTGNLLISNDTVLEQVLSTEGLPLAVHAEDESMIQSNMQAYKIRYGENVPIQCHSVIRSREACVAATSKMIDKARKYHSQMHILHVSTANELQLLQKAACDNITFEVCPSYLYFCDEDYQEFGSIIKCNPAIKTAGDKLSLIQAAAMGAVSTVGSDHAPHLWAEKQQPYFSCPSGMPMVQHSMLILLKMVKQGILSIEQLAALTAHHPADIYHVDKRGYIREGYYADMILVDMDAAVEVNKNNIYYKCKWSPLEGKSFPASVTATFVNGVKVYDKGQFADNSLAMELKFNR